MARRLIRSSHKQVGASPGQLVHIGERHGDTIGVTLIRYDREQFSETLLAPPRLAAALPLPEADTVAWLDIVGLHDPRIIELLGQRYALHPLLQEDILDTRQRPKVESDPGALFVVLKVPRYDPETDEIGIEQISLVLADGLVLTFQERPDDMFEEVRQRLRHGRGKIRSRGADYLAYALIDALVDSCFVLLEKLGDRIEEVEEELLRQAGPETLSAIHTLRREMILLRKAIWPLREILATLTREEHRLIESETVLFLRDVHDHALQVVETLESFRELLTDLLDLYLSSASHRMNEIMKVLTVIATIFIPLTFIAGVYGMNFEYMPELHWRFGYALAWGVMLAVAAALLIWFRRRSWL